MFQKYKYVLAVYREGSFTGAAQKLFISQPSLSVAIRSVEREIGAPLFERSGSGAVPTEMGEAYIAAARKMLAAEAEFEKQRLDIQGLQTGKLVVGGSNYLVSCPGSSRSFAAAIPMWRSRWPRPIPAVCGSCSTGRRWIWSSITLKRGATFMRNIPLPMSRFFFACPATARFTGGWSPSGSGRRRFLTAA